MKSVQRVLGAALIATAAAAAPPAAHGASDTVVQLEYQADEQGGCVGKDELRRMVAGQLGHDPFRSDADQRVTISIARAEGGFQGRIVWTEADGRQVGERLVVSRSRDCREIAANVAFAVALQLQLVERGAADQEDAAASTPEQPPPTIVEKPPAPVVPDRPAGSSEAPAGSAPASPDRLLLAVGAGPAVGIGMTPEVTAFGRVFVVARIRRLSAEIAADGALPAAQRAWDGSGVVVTAMGSSAAGCGHVAFASACLLGRLGWLRARGMGVTAPTTSWGWFGEVGMRLAAARELGRFSAGVHADGLVMLSSWNVTLNEAVAWSVPRVGLVVGADVAVRFF